MRSINPGLSARVKNEEAYANTRKNNKEFAQAGMIAAVLGRMVKPKFRPMFLPFSQAKILKEVLALIKSDPTASTLWGDRGLTADGITELPSILSRYAKTPFSEYCSDLDAEYTATTPAQHLIEGTIVFASDIETKLNAIGAQGVFVNFIAVKGAYARPALENEYKATIRVSMETSTQDESEPAGGTSASASLSVVGPSSAGGLGIDYVVAVIMPYRTIGGENNILQEHCSFAAVEAVLAE